MLSYKFWIVSSRILCSSSWRESSSCFGGVGWESLPLVSKTYHSSSIMLKSGYCAGQRRCWSSPSCCSNHDWTVPAVWLEALSSWKTALLFRNNVWLVGWMHLITHPVHYRAMNRNNGDNRILLLKPSQNLLRVSLLDSGILDCRLSWVFPKHELLCREQCEGQLIWPYQFPVVWCPGFMVVTPLFTHLSITFSNQRFSNHPYCGCWICEAHVSHFL
jgi:hypothetical protein